MHKVDFHMQPVVVSVFAGNSKPQLSLQTSISLVGNSKLFTIRYLQKIKWTELS